MPFVANGDGQYRLVRRSPGIIRGCIFGPTLVLGLLFAAGAAVGALRLLHVLRGTRPDAGVMTLALVMGGGSLMALFALFGLTGRSEVVIDTARRTVMVALRAFGRTLRRRERPFAAFSHVEVMTGLGRSTPGGPSHRFFFAVMRGPEASVVLENVDHQGAHAQGAQVAALLGVRFVPRPEG